MGKKSKTRILILWTVALVTMLGLAGIAFALTPAGTIIGNSATATYYDENNNEYTTTSNLVTTEVQEVCGVDVTPDTTVSKQGVAGQTVYMPFAVTNKGNGQNTFNLGTSATGTSGATYTIYIDSNGNGVVDAGEGVASSVTLNADAAAAIIVAVAVPAGAADTDTYSFTLTATGTAPTGCADIEDGSVDVISDALLTISKQVDKSVSAPAGVLTYTVSFQNVGTVAAKAKDDFAVDYDNDGDADASVEGILVSDAIPSGSAYKAGSASGQPQTSPTGYVVYSSNGTSWFRTEANAGGAAAITNVGFFMQDSGPIDTTLGNVLDPNQQGFLSFQVTVDDPFEESDGYVDNDASVAYSDSANTSHEVTSNEVHTQIPASTTADISTSDRKATWNLVEEDSGTNWHNDNVVASAPAGHWVDFTHSASNNDGVYADVISLETEDAPLGWIVEFWNADGTAKLIDTNSDGKIDLGTVAAHGIANYMVKVFIPADEDTGGSVDILATSGNNPAEVDRTQDTVTDIITANVDIAQQGSGGDWAINSDNPSDNNTDGTADNDDILPGDMDTTINPGETISYPIQVVNTGGSSDSYSLTYTGLPSGATATISTDADCDGIVESGDYQITDTPLMGGTALRSAASATNTLSVYSVANFSVNDKLIVGLDGVVRTVTGVDTSANTITVSGSAITAASGTLVSEYICVALVVQTAITTPPGSVNIVVEATSHNSGASNDMDMALTVNEVCGISVSPDNSGTVPPSGSTTYEHMIQNSGNTAADVTITVPSTGTQLTYVILDADGNPQGTSYTITGLAAGASANFSVKVQAPSSVTSGTVETINVTVTSNGAGGCSDTVQDSTSVIEGYIELTKYQSVADTDGPNAQTGICTGSADSVTGGPCDEITYRIKFKNVGIQNAVNVVITDPIPDHTTYVAGSLGLDTNCDGTIDTAYGDGTGDADQAEYDSTNNLVRFRVGDGATSSVGGTLVPGAEGCVIFKVKIQ